MIGHGAPSSTVYDYTWTTFSNTFLLFKIILPLKRHAAPNQGPLLHLKRTHPVPWFHMFVKRLSMVVVKFGIYPKLE